MLVLIDVLNTPDHNFFTQENKFFIILKVPPLSSRNLIRVGEHSGPGGTWT